MTTPTDIERWWALLPPSKQGALRVVGRQELSQPYLYHISTDHHLRSMTPSVTKRTLASEDRAIPRISVAPSLAGCILAYQSCGYDFESDVYNGWYVYGVPYQHAVRPDRTLLPDVDTTDEHWLVTFDPDTVIYTPKPIAKFFIQSVESSRRLRRIITSYSGYIDVIDPTGLTLVTGQTLPMGRYELSWNTQDLKQHDTVAGITTTSVSAAEYQSHRRATVSLLGVDEFRRPNSSNW